MFILDLEGMFGEVVSHHALNEVSQILYLQLSTCYFLHVEQPSNQKHLPRVMSVISCSWFAIGAMQYSDGSNVVLLTHHTVKCLTG